MAALTAANGGAEVALWERNKSLGRKLAITGKGRCNITNMADTKDLVKNMPGNGSFLYSAFTRFSAEDTWDFFEQHGLQLKVERGRRVFPLSDNAHEVVEVLVQALHEAGVKIEYNLRAKELALQNKQILGVYDSPGRLYPADAVIIATGATAKYLGLDDEKKYAGMGVSACATCDGFFYRKKVVAVVGGGDTACEEAVYLAGLAKKVYLIVRKPFLRASKIMQERVMKHENIDVLFEHNAVGLFGENGVEGVHLVKRIGESDEERYDLAIDGFFLAIGHQPNSDIFKAYLDTDETGYIITEGDSPRTKVPGVFAAGDIADPHYRQAITAAGSGCKAALEAERYLSSKCLV